MAKRENVPIDIRAIGKSAKVPPAYLAKIFQALVRAGIVTSHRGPHGGFLLKKDPRKISLLDVVNAVDDETNSPLSRCIMGLDICADKNACVLHDIWVTAAARMKQQLEKVSVRDLKGFNQQLRPFAKSRRVLSASLRSVFK
ncbi:MAG: RrF2 family transcriptional regulator [Elusimicrobiota bacterium]